MTGTGMTIMTVVPADPVEAVASAALAVAAASAAAAVAAAVLAAGAVVLAAAVLAGAGDTEGACPLGTPIEQQKHRNIPVLLLSGGRSPEPLTFQSLPWYTVNNCA